MNLPQIVDVTFENKWIDNLSNEDYHADSSAVSSSGVREVLVSPHAFYRRYVLGEERKSTKAMNFGKTVHMAILEPERFKSLYKIMPVFMGKTLDGKESDRSKEAQEKKKAWFRDQPRDAVILTIEDYDKLMRMIDSVLNYNGGMIANILKGSVFEKSGYFRDDVTGLKCRFRPDILREDLSVLPDLKTTRDPSRESFEYEIGRLGYHAQLAFYSMGVKKIHGKQPDTHCFISVQNEFPFHTAVYELSPRMLQRGMEIVRRGLDKIAECVTKNEWHGLQPNGAEFVELPNKYDPMIEM